MAEPKRYRERTEITLLGRRLQALDLTREISPEIPVYPGHMKVAIWDHLTHAESKLRIGETPLDVEVMIQIAEGFRCGDRHGNHGVRD